MTSNANPNIEPGKDFPGYGNVDGLVHKGEAKIADREWPTTMPESSQA